jgi:hypothetical protein
MAQHPHRIRTVSLGNADQTAGCAPLSARLLCPSGCVRAQVGSGGLAYR